MTLFSLAASGLRTGEAQSLQCSGASSSLTNHSLPHSRVWTSEALSEEKTKP